jgi:hypothetical protein
MPYYWITPRFWASGGGGETNTAPWTSDLNIPPSSVYGLASLNLYEAESGSGASVGFLSYVTQDPDTGIPSENVIAGMGGNIWGLGWLAPSLMSVQALIGSVDPALALPQRVREGRLPPVCYRFALVRYAEGRTGLRL